MATHTREREKLQALLKQCQEIRSTLSTTTPTAATKLIQIASEAIRIAENIGHEHGIALSKEMYVTGKTHERLCMYASQPPPQQSSTEATTPIPSTGKDSASEEKEKEPVISKREAEENAFWESQEKELVQVQLVAKQYGDIQLALRTLEGLATVHNMTGNIIKEIKVTEMAAAIMAAQNKKTVANTCALIDLYERSLEMLTSAEKGVDIQSEPFLEVTLKFWEELKWLSSAQEFDFEGFIKRHKSSTFKVAITVGDVLANPLVLGEGKVEHMRTSLLAYDLALRIANIVNDVNYICTANVHRIRTFYGRSTPNERRDMEETLRQMAENIRPTSAEVVTLLQDIQNQKQQFPNDQAPPVTINVPSDT